MPGRDADDARPRTTLGQRLTELVLKPAPAGAGDPGGRPRSAEELQTSLKSADDKERLIGLIAAPVAAALAFFISAVLIADDPAARLADGAVNHLHVSVALYEEALAALLVLAVGMLAASLLRKRLVLGICAALYGLTVFNLHYWGFGVPFLMVGAWLLVRSYRAQRDLKAATGETPSGGGSAGRGGPGGSGSAAAPRARASRRYTPPKG